jgi:hypothetical protein
MTQISISQTVEPEIEIKPELRVELLVELRIFKALALDLAELQAAKELCLTKIESLRERVGEHSFGVDGFTVTRVDGQTTSKLVVQKLLAQDVTPAMIAQATVTTPKRAFTKVSYPGQRRSDKAEAE